MKSSDSVIFQKASVCTSVLLPMHKSTALLPSAVMPAPKSVKILLPQEYGVKATVKKGSKVYVGSIIADSEQEFGLPIHSSVSGKVISVGKITLPDGSTAKAVHIEADGSQIQDNTLKKPRISSAKSLIKASRDCGLIETGSQKIPTHQKLNKAFENNAHTLVINCTECDPFMTSNQLCATEEYNDIFKAVYLIKKHLNIKNVIFAIDGDQKSVIDRFSGIIDKNSEKNEGIRVMRLNSLCPAGEEKLLVYFVLKQIIPNNKQAEDIGCMVLSIGNIAKLGNYIRTGMPFVSKRITVEGDIINNPQNVIVPIGANVNDIFEFCAGLNDIPSRIIMGGVLNGTVLPDGEFYVQKNTDMLLAQSIGYIQNPTACIHCGRCVKHCPIKLYPYEVENAVSLGKDKKLASLNVELCIECGFCNYICPASRPLVQAIKLAKQQVKEDDSNSEPAFKERIQSFFEGIKTHLKKED